MVQKKPRFKDIRTTPLKRFPPAGDKSTIVNTASIVKQLRLAGERMLAKEFEEMKYMEKVRGRFMSRLVHELLQGNITREQFREKIGVVDRRLREKVLRAESITEKRAFLLQPRLEKLASLATGDPFFKYIYNHEAFVELVKRRFMTRTKRPVQSLVMFDVDLVKKTNSKAGSHLRGGTVLLSAYAEAVKEVCDKYGGLGSRYGTDEFSLHFDRPKVEVEAIVSEMNTIAMNKLLHGPLRELILDKKVPGTCTGAIIEIDFSFHKNNSQQPGQIYSNVMDNISSTVMALKKSGSRGRTVVVEDNKILEKNLPKK